MPECLAAASPRTISQIRAVLERAWAAGARPFEVIAGAPRARYGARITFDGAVAAMAETYGLGAHPWGVPAWVGVRVRDDGETRAKAYHKNFDANAFPLWRELPGELYPVMASLDGDAREIYLRARAELPWSRFAAACLATVGAAPIEFAPRPRPAAHGFCVSLRFSRDTLSAVSLFADWRTLPAEREIERIWAAQLAPEDARAYELALAAVRSAGRLPSGAWHAMLAWSFEAGGEQHRAVSLSVPVLKR